MSIEKLEEAMTNEYSNRMFNLEYRQLKMKIYAYGNSMFFAIAIFILLVDVIVNKEPNNDIKNIYFHFLSLSVNNTQCVLYSMW